MLEGKALVVAIMMLTAAPIAATDQGQALIGDVTYEIGEMLNDEEETNVVDKVIDESDIEDKELLLTDEKIEEDCLTLKQWKETLVPEEKIVEEREQRDGARGDKKESNEERKEEPGEITNLIGMERQEALDLLEESGLTYRYCDLDGNDGCAMTDDFVPGRHTLEFQDGIVVSHDVEKEFELKEDELAHYEDKDRKDWNKEFIDEEACLSAEEWALKFESDKVRDKPCFTLDEARNKITNVVKNHKKGWDRADFDRKDKIDRDWNTEIAYLVKLCQEGDEEACEELLELRDDVAEDSEESDESDEEEGARGAEESDDEHSHSDDEADDHSHDDDEADDHEHHDERDRKEGLRAEIKELAEACKDGDQESCSELREIMANMADKRKDGDWGKDRKEWIKDACLTLEEWREILVDNKDKIKDHVKDEFANDRDNHRDAFIREMLKELKQACEEENDEEACAQFEEIVANLEERKEDCDEEKDESDEEWEEDDESEEEDADQDESDEDDSDDDNIEE